jgi:23S rRNA pseudouridine955/2504/2580 synthase
MKYLVPETQKLIHFLQCQLDPAPSGKMLRRVLEANLCRVNGTIERFGTTEVRKGAIVELSPAWQSVLVPSMNKFQTLFEDKYLLIVDKPAGWICVDTECARAFGPNRFLVHRLDKETTGVLLIAKSAEVREAMFKLFRERGIEKLYYAIADGTPAEERGHRKTYFAKVGSFEGQSCWGSRSKGLEAETHWKVLDRGKNASLIACQPITGRTHQIRVHLAEIGHPILVDRQYAKSYRCKFFATRPLLHSARTRFKHPITQEQIDISAPLPLDFVDALEELGFQALQES